MKPTVCALSLAVALGASPALARTDDGLPSMRISYADLDLTKAAGRAALERRVDSAVKRLCEAPSPLNLVAMERSHKCRKTASAGARGQLAAIYDHDRYAANGRIVRTTSD